MSDANSGLKPQSQASKYWLLYVATAAFFGIVWGIDRDVEVEVYGFGIKPVYVIIVVYVIGVVAGWASREQRNRGR